MSGIHLQQSTLQGLHRPLSADSHRKLSLPKKRTPRSHPPVHSLAGTNIPRVSHAADWRLVRDTVLHRTRLRSGFHADICPRGRNGNTAFLCGGWARATQRSRGSQQGAPAAVSQDAHAPEGGGKAKVSSAADGGDPWQQVKKFGTDQFLPIVLITGLVAGFAFPTPGQVAQREWGLSRFTTFFIFIISGLNLRAGDVRSAADAWPALLYGLVAILLITPMASLAAVRLPLNPPELAVGLGLFFCMPTTLSSGVSLTQAAGANTALALALTIGSNLIGICTMPFILSALVGGGAGVTIPALPLVTALLRQILVPLLIGWAARALLPDVAQTVDKSKRQLSMLSSFLLSLVPWMQISCARNDLLKISPVQLALTAMGGIVIHLAFILWNTAAMRGLRLGESGGEASHWPSVERAVVLMASMKALPVAVTLLPCLGGSLGSPALLMLPCIATHLSMIMIDSILVTYWLGKDQQQAATAAAVLC